MTQDFQPPLGNRGPRPSSRSHWRHLFWLLPLLAVLSFLFAGQGSFSSTVAGTVPASAVPPAPPPPEIRRELIDGMIRPGDTITGILGDYFTPLEIHQLNTRSRDVFPLTQICAGKPFRICLTDGRFEEFLYDIDQNDQLVIRRQEDDFDVERVPIAYTVETGMVAGIITSSLFETVAEIGEEPELALALADIFAWDIDFILDIREGDSFHALVEKRFRDGKPAGYGKVLAAEFVNQGETFRAFLFRDGDHSPSYYDQQGNSVRKAFLKAPLSFSRISSGFSRRRFHPITKTWKAHPAIDYAAPTGTPIKSVGDGTIVRIGYTKGNGNYIKIRHNSVYETLYLHMTRFAKGMKKGKRLAQGQVIGYVGSTGLATGPHLCFRMYKNGTPVNPYRVKTPAAAPVSANRMAAFQESIAPLVARLDHFQQQTQVADASLVEPNHNRP